LPSPSLIKPLAPCSPAVSLATSQAVVVREALVGDVPVMAEIINSFAGQQLMLPRSQFQFYQHVRDFYVAERDGEVLACGALQFVWGDLAEIRSLAVRKDWQGQGIGRSLVEHLLGQARRHGVPRVFCLTYQQGFFEELGFYVVSRESLPHKIWGDCLNCPKYPDCDEIAMMYDLAQGARA
jgi:amino-acid N-acetyltransferase